MLYSPDYEVLQRFNDDWFIVFTPKTLGNLKYIHIWHDSYGNKPMWYCQHVEVICIRENKKYNFKIERWFSILPNVEYSDHIILREISHDWVIETKDVIEMVVRDGYSWPSLFLW